MNHIEVVRSCADPAITKAVDQPKALPDYSQAGEIFNVFFLPVFLYKQKKQNQQSKALSVTCMNHLL